MGEGPEVCGCPGQYVKLLRGLCTEEGRSYHPSKTIVIEHQSRQLPRAVAARGQAEKITNSQSLRPGPEEGVGVRLPPPTDAETRDLK